MATHPSNVEFGNPLDVLAAVASETLRYEICQPEKHEVSVPVTNKRQNKKSSPSVLTFVEVKCMSGKTLIDKFSESMFDEYTKKYSYKCAIVPGNCSKIFRSFGNEKKAYDEMKMHLLQHVDILTEEYESNGYSSAAVFVPRSPASSSKHVERMSKKSLKKQHSSHTGVLHRTNSSKKSKKSSLYAGKRKFQESKEYTSIIKNNFSNKVDENASTELSKEAKVLYYGRELTHKYSDIIFDNENYSSYNQYLDFAIYNDAEVNELSSGSEQALDMNDSNSFDADKMQDLPDLNGASSEKPFPFFQDHNYTYPEGPKSDRLLPSELKRVPRLYENPFSYVKPNKLPVALESPKFPFVFQPVGPKEAGTIVEVEGFYESDNPMNYGKQIEYFLDGPSPKIIADQVCDETSSDSEEKRGELYLKGSGVCNSVLECVENIENKKHSSSSVPKNGISARENDENLENHQKNERDLALKYIAKMHSKGKKKLTDSLKCKICPNKTFTAQATLLHHYRSHAGIKPYSCKLCDSKFTRQHSLNYHMLIHQNAIRFTCPTCGRTFRHPSHFNEHKRRHTGETPYHCTDCNLHFKTRNTFKRHLKTRHGKLLTAGGIEDLNS